MKLCYRQGGTFGITIYRNRNMNGQMYNHLLVLVLDLCLLSPHAKISTFSLVLFASQYSKMNTSFLSGPSPSIAYPCHYLTDACIGVEIWLMWPCRQSLGRSTVPLAMYLFQFPCKLMKEKGRVKLKRPIYSSFFWLFNFWWVKRTSRKIIGKHHCSKLNILWLLFSSQS